MSIFSRWESGESGGGTALRKISDCRHPPYGLRAPGLPLVETIARFSGIRLDMEVPVERNVTPELGVCQLVHALLPVLLAVYIVVLVEGLSTV